MKYPRDGWLSHHEAEILESEVPEFFTHLGRRQKQ